MAYRSIDELCEQLEAKREQAREGGGAKAVEKQRQKGKGTARERIARCWTKEVLWKWMNSFSTAAAPSGLKRANSSPTE